MIIINVARLRTRKVSSECMSTSGFWSISGPIMNGKNVSKSSALNKNTEVIVSVNFKCFSQKLKYEVHREEHPKPVVKI